MISFHELPNNANTENNSFGNDVASTFQIEYYAKTHPMFVWNPMNFKNWTIILSLLNTNLMLQETVTGFCTYELQILFKWNLKRVIIYILEKPKCRITIWVFCSFDFSLFISCQIYAIILIYQFIIQMLKNNGNKSLFSVMVSTCKYSKHN